eukprot:g4565.t1
MSATMIRRFALATCCYFFCVAAAAAAASTPLPRLSYRYAVFAVPDPAAAASFMVEFTGAESISHNRSQWQLSDASAGGRSADVSAVRLYFGGDDNKAAWSDVYFTRDPSLPGDREVQAFTERVAATHSWANDDWDWWQDWHLAFSVTDIDAVAAKLLKANVRFVSRGSIYFPIPGTAVTIQVLGHGSGGVYWAEPFLFCRHTSDEGTGRAKPYAINTSDITAMPDRPLPAFVPSHQSLATADANETARWAYKFLNVSGVEASTGPAGSHAYAGGTCAQIRWMEVSPDGWELHFIEQFVKRQGQQKVAGWEREARRLHGDMSRKDAAQNFRVGFQVPSLAPYISNLEAHGEPFYHDTVHDPKRIRVQTPSGYVFELFETATGAAEEQRLAGRLRGAARAANAVAARTAIAQAVHE